MTFTLPINWQKINEDFIRVFPYILRHRLPTEVFTDPSVLAQNIDELWLEFSEVEPPEEAKLRPQPAISRFQSLDQFMRLPLLHIRFNGRKAVMWKAVCLRHPFGTVAKQQIDNGWLWTVVPPNL